MKTKSARFRKSVAVQQIFVESGRHFQRSRHVNQNFEKGACVPNRSNQNGGQEDSEEAKVAQFPRERNLPADSGMD